MTRTVSFGLFALALTVTCCLAAISEVKNNNPVTQKPGRFLSLPVPQKCSQSKLSKIFCNKFCTLRKRRPVTVFRFPKVLLISPWILFTIIIANEIARHCTYTVSTSFDHGKFSMFRFVFKIVFFSLLTSLLSYCLFRGKFSVFFFCIFKVRSHVLTIHGPGLLIV